MKRNTPMLVVLICTLIAIPFCVASEEKTVSPTVAIEIDVQDDDISKMVISFVINNPSEREVSLSGYECYVYRGGVHDQHSESRWGTDEPLKSMETITLNTSYFITGGDPLQRFLRDGFVDIRVNGSLFVKAGSDSFEVPFENTTTVYLKVGEEDAKRAVCPNITGIELETTKLMTSSGEVTDIFLNICIAVKNPNPVSAHLDIDYNVYFKKDEKWKYLYTGFTESTIEPMESGNVSMEYRISDEEVFQYLMRGSPTDIRIKGSMFMFPEERGWSPTYFELPFETVVTTKNGPSVSEEATPTPTSSPMASSTPGFEAISIITCLLISTHLLRRR
jgi:hypothetical protein